MPGGCGRGTAPPRAYQDRPRALTRAGKTTSSGLALRWVVRHRPAEEGCARTVCGSCSWISESLNMLGRLAGDYGVATDLRTGRGGRVYGVDYTIFDDEAGGTLYVTPYGVPVLDELWPELWYGNRRYVTEGQRMTSGTGTVYRVPACGMVPGGVNLVVKFSRFAEEVPLDVRSTFDEAIHQSLVEEAVFLDPFQEFGILMDLRRGRFGPSEVRIGTKRPLAIYRAPVPEPAWQLGRRSSLFSLARQSIEADQSSAAAPVSLDADRVYALLFHWVKGVNLQEAAEADLLSPAEVEAMTRRVGGELRAKGFVVLDHKPQHIIVRPTEEGLLRRGGKLAYAIIDFELLQRTDDYRRWLAACGRSTLR